MTFLGRHDGGDLVAGVVFHDTAGAVGVSNGWNASWTDVVAAAGAVHPAATSSTTPPATTWLPPWTPGSPRSVRSGCGAADRSGVLIAPWWSSSPAGPSNAGRHHDRGDGLLDVMTSASAPQPGSVKETGLPVARA